MIAFSFVFLLISIAGLVLWQTNAVPSFTSYAPLAALISGGLFILLFIIGIFSKPPKV
ncbi:MAG: hypothetical protein GX639_17315 [Fibrobacter sp.]|nr:hypothetical protein [Fibrobacter sp.]